MTKTRDRVRAIGSIVRYYWRRPHRLGELLNWASDRNHTTLELKFPWWNYQAVRAVKTLLPANARVFEYGGGGSTIWLMNQGALCTTVEHDEEWYALLSAELPASCVVMNRPAASTGSVRSIASPGDFFDDYVHAIDSQPDSSLDLVIVDGRARVDCGIAAIQKVKPGGMLLLDDSDRERYLPLHSELRDWVRVSYRGVKVGGGGLVETTIFRKPPER